MTTVFSSVSMFWVSSLLKCFISFSILYVMFRETKSSSKQFLRRIKVFIISLPGQFTKADNRNFFFSPPKKFDPLRRHGNPQSLGFSPWSFTRLYFELWKYQNGFSNMFAEIRCFFFLLRMTSTLTNYSNLQWKFLCKTSAFPLPCVSLGHTMHEWGFLEYFCQSHPLQQILLETSALGLKCLSSHVKQLRGSETMTVFYI